MAAAKGCLPAPGRVPVWDPDPSDDTPVLARARAAIVAWVEDGAGAEVHPDHAGVRSALDGLAAQALQLAGAEGPGAAGAVSPVTAYLAGLACLYGAVALPGGAGPWLEAAAAGFSGRGEEAYRGLALLQAGQAAEARGDLPAALQLYRQAADALAGEPGWRGAARLCVAEVLARLGADREEWEAAFAAAAADLGAAGDHAGRGVCLRTWAQAARDAGAPDRAVSLLDGARSSFLAADDPVRAAECDLEDGLIHQVEGGDGSARVREAVRLYQRALQLVRQEESPGLYGVLHSNLASAYLALPPDPEREPFRQALAVQSAQAAVGALDPDRDPAQWAMAQNNLGAAFMALAASAGRPDLLVRAEGALRAALAVRRRLGDPGPLASTLANLAECLLRRTYPEPEHARQAGLEARELLAEALDLGRRHGLPGMERVERRLSALAGSPGEVI